MADADEIRSAAFAYYARLQRVKEHLDRHLEDDIALTTAAGFSGLQGIYLCAFFRSKPGLGFRGWVTRRRVEHPVKE